MSKSENSGKITDWQEEKLDSIMAGLPRMGPITKKRAKKFMETLSISDALYWIYTSNKTKLRKRIGKVRLRVSE